MGQIIKDYVESKDIITNPERGIQKYSKSDEGSLQPSTLNDWRMGKDKITVIYRCFLLKEFLNSKISEEYLDKIRKDFKIIRDARMKSLVRFAYNYDEKSAEPKQPSKSQILKHITQIEPILKANKDVIFTHQAGFIGAFGEWYYTDAGSKYPENSSKEFGTKNNITDTQWQNRKEVLDAIISATPSQTPIQVRYPRIKWKLYDLELLNGITAYKNTARARIGFYNDAFLNEDGDMGTYSDVENNENPIGTTDYEYLSNETLYTPMTGETNGVNKKDRRRTKGKNAVFEMNLTNWTTINGFYHPKVIKKWKKSGHYKVILRKLGYRFVLDHSNFEVVDGTLNVEIHLRNVGFARLIKGREAFLIFQHKKNKNVQPFLLNEDPRTWAGSFNISARINLKLLQKGKYDCFLNLPDPDPELAKIPEFSIRIANKGTWIKSLGFNNLFQEVEVL